MFEWFKNKLNNLIPKDIDKSMMSSVFTSIKLGEKLVVPENITCFVSFNDKLYATLVPGKYTFSRELLLDLYDKQTHGDKAINHLKVDFFFVNSKTFDFSFSYIDKVPVANKLTKLIFDVDFSANVFEEKKFYTFVTNELYSTNAEYTKRLLLNTLEEFLRKYFLRKKFTSLNNPIAEIQDLDTKVVSYMQKIGVNIKNFRLNISSKNNPKPQEKEKIGIFSNNQNDKVDNLDNKKENTDNAFPSISLDDYNIDDYTLKLKEQDMQDEQHESFDKTEVSTQPAETETEVTQAQEIDTNVCPNCKGKFIAGSLFCHRCGYRRN